MMERDAASKPWIAGIISSWLVSSMFCCFPDSKMLAHIQNAMFDIVSSFVCCCAALHISQKFDNSESGQRALFNLPICQKS
jgi:hypothetical protein